VVFPVGETEMLAPLPTGVPPQLPEYHSHEAPVPSVPPVTLSVEELPAHISACTAEAPVGASESVFTFMLSEAVAVTGLAQVAFETISQSTTSLLLSVLLL
jgi:hypothetical protein